jgi:hypothetical protein
VVTLALPPNAVVVAYLREPKEKVWGILLSVDACGFVVQGIPLSTFDDWLRDVAGGEAPTIGLSTMFFPLLRLEKILLDETVGGVPSLEARFQQRIGMSVMEFLQGERSTPESG